MKIARQREGKRIQRITIKYNQLKNAVEESSILEAMFQEGQGASG